MYSRIVNNRPVSKHSQSFIDNNQDNIVNGQLVSEWTLAPMYGGDFVEPIYDVNTQTYSEGATLEQLKEKYTPEIQKRFTYLETRALSSSMDKDSQDTRFLYAMREIYENKYRVANGSITSGKMYDSIIATLQKEMEYEFTEAVLDSLLTSYGITPTGTHLNKMFQLVVFKYETGEGKFYPFSQFCENFRNKSTLWLESQDITRLKQGFNMVDTLPDSMTLAEAQTKFTEFDNI